MCHGTRSAFADCAFSDGVQGKAQACCCGQPLLQHDGHTIGGYDIKACARNGVDACVANGRGAVFVDAPKDFLLAGNIRVVDAFADARLCGISHQRASARPGLGQILARSVYLPIMGSLVYTKGPRSS